MIDKKSRKEGDIRAGVTMARLTFRTLALSLLTIAAGIFLAAYLYSSESLNEAQNDFKEVITDLVVSDSSTKLKPYGKSE